MDKKLVHILLGVALIYVVTRGSRNPWLDPNERLPFGLTAEDLLSGEYDDDDDDEPSPYDRLPFGFKAPSDDET